MTVSLRRRVHRSHGSERLQVFGVFESCSRCLRVLGFRCGETTFAAAVPCSPDEALIQRAREVLGAAKRNGKSAVAAELREALRGHRNDLADLAVVMSTMDSRIAESRGRHAVGD